jgi:hypothetical protein
MKKITLFICFIFPVYLQAQYNSEANPIMTGVPFLNYHPDARGTGIGNTGVATNPDPNSIFWNPAKFAFIEDEGYHDLGFTGSFNPGFIDIEKRYNVYASVFKTLGKQTIASSFKYHRWGSTLLTDELGSIIGKFKPTDFSVDLAYARKFSSGFSGAIAVRYLQSKLMEPGLPIAGYPTKIARSVAGDIAIFYRKHLSISNLEKASFNLGLNISNIGSKISYVKNSEEKEFIPTNLRFGGSFNIEQIEHKFSISFDVNKLLVPTSPVYARDSNGQPIIDENGDPVVDKGMDPDVSVLKGMIQSFYDAPDGFKEEMQEFYYGLGAEYWYKDLFALRTGYYTEHENKGNTQLYNLGTGFRYKFAQLDFTYTFNLNKDKYENLKGYYQDNWYITLILYFNTSPSQAQ